MKRPVEHGNIFASIILGGSSITLAVLQKRDIYSLLFWIPIWMGLFLYDIPFARVWKSKKDVTWISFIILISVTSIYIDYLLIIPYSIFFVDYALRLYLSSNRLNYIGTTLGIIAYVALFGCTVGLNGLRGLLLMISLFVFMIGSEFTVRAKLSKKRVLLLYDILPPFLSILNPVFLIFMISIVRIPIAMSSKGLKIVGVTETVLLFVVTIVLSLFYIIKP